MQGIEEGQEVFKKLSGRTWSGCKWKGRCLLTKFKAPPLTLGDIAGTFNVMDS